MTSSSILEPLRAPIQALQNLIARFGNQGVIIGGIAASILGKPRLTADADAMMLLALEDIPQLLEIAKEEGLRSRIPDIEEFARRSRVLLLQHKESGINVDISLGLLPFEVEAVERGQAYETGSLQIRLPTPEDLIILKAVAHRPKDMLDIEAVIAMQKELDHQRIKFWVSQFAELLETPELWTDVEKMLKKAQKRGISSKK
ncbi:MAG: hypothetical protein DYG89_28945 [Caldilinea sp. CFX5]|nr:hypothetical protein [Caldilinea sp. CFX5]